MNILEQIVETKKEEVKKIKRDYSLSFFKDSEFFEKKALDFKKALSSDNDLAIIAEVKKASPSKGLIRPDFDPVEIADVYFEYGANAVSVLTDEKYFMGSLEYLKEIAKIKSAPVLRKEFIIDEYQVYQSKYAGADAILLISEILSAEQIKELTIAAREIGLYVLLEMHSDVQMPKIDFALNNILGINNRNLENFSVDLHTTEKIADSLPEDVVCVSESGILNKDDLDFLKNTRANAILVGEHLVRSEKIEPVLKELKMWCQRG